jgi:hypothetical protein
MRESSPSASRALQCRGYDRINDRSGFSQGKNMNENTWQQMLVDSLPKPFVRGFRGVPFSAGYPSCRDGWQDVIRLVERVETALRCRRCSAALPSVCQHRSAAR